MGERFDRCVAGLGTYYVPFGSIIWYFEKYKQEMHCAVVSILTETIQGDAVTIHLSTTNDLTTQTGRNVASSTM
jgi:hypothetical protein